MRLKLTLLLVFAACNEATNPWAINWTREQRRSWPLGCPGATLTEQEGAGAFESVIAKRTGDGNEIPPIVCAVGVNHGRVTSVEVSLTHAPRARDQRSPEVALLLDHVLATVPKRHHGAIQAVAESEPPVRVRIGRFQVSGGYDRDFWSIYIVLVP